MADRTVAEQMITVLRQAGVQRVYGVVGDSLNPVVDAIRRSDGAIEWVHVRNEEAGAFAAAAEAETTGRLAVCAGSCGPGNTHLIQGLYDAHRSQVPVLGLASHIPSAQIGTGFFQETHPERVFTDCSSYCEMVSTSAQMPRVLRTAVQHALGQSGVSVVAFPGDVAALPVAHPTGVSAFLQPHERATPIPAQAQVEALAEALNAARKPVLFAGAGVRGAHAEVMRLAATIQAPIGHSLRGKEWIQFDNPHDVGMSGLLGYGACHDALHEADLVLLLGTDFPYDSFLPGRHTVQIDHDPTRFGRRTPLHLAVHGDVAATLRAVQPLLKQRQDRSFLDDMLHRHGAALERVVGAYTKNIEHHTPIHPEYVAAVLDDAASDDAIFTVDTGMNNVWAARYLTPNGRRRVIGSFLHGSMANALPHAIGAQLAHPGRQVVALAGDGGLGMLMGELLTLKKYARRAPVKVVVFNNGALGMIKLEMMVSGYPEYEIDNGDVDYAAIARACGVHGIRVTKPAELGAALAEAFATPGPALVDVVTDPNALSLPPTITAAQLKGFALAAGRTVLDGGVGKMIDLARSNLRNIPRP